VTAQPQQATIEVLDPGGPHHGDVHERLPFGALTYMESPTEEEMDVAEVVYVERKFAPNRMAQPVRYLFPQAMLADRRATRSAVAERHGCRRDGRPFGAL
jgi:hypothetical protein